MKSKAQNSTPLIQLSNIINILRYTYFPLSHTYCKYNVYKIISFLVWNDMYLFGQILILEIVINRFCETVYNYIYQNMYINFPFTMLFLEGYI